MANPLHTLRVKPVELLRQPGAVQTIEESFDAEALEVADERVAGPIGVALTATSTIDGIVVGGSVTVPYRTVCRRCARDLEGEGAANVEELYQFEPDDDEAYVIEGNQIDLAPAVRQYALLELPANLLCRDDCAGLCPNCGTDLNEATCGCDTTVRDPRWAALDDLKLDE